MLISALSRFSVKTVVDETEAFLCLCGAGENSLNPCQKDLRMIRLGNEIVCPGAEA